MTIPRLSPDFQEKTTLKANLAKMEAEDPPFFISLPEVFRLQILLILL